MRTWCVRIAPKYPECWLVEFWISSKTAWATETRIRNYGSRDQYWRILFRRAGCWLDRTGISWILIGVFWISAQPAWAAGTRLGNQDLVFKSWMRLDRSGISWILIGVFWISAQTALAAGTKLMNQYWMLIGQNRNLLVTDWCILNFSTDCLGSWNQTQESGLKDLFLRAGCWLDRTKISRILIGVF